MYEVKHMSRFRPKHGSGAGLVFFVSAPQMEIKVFLLVNADTSWLIHFSRFFVNPYLQAEYSITDK
jgi:hypothetical protein